ncbi:MAG: hypothetical protein AAB649_06490 [Patescibacteria group bacterium]
MSTSLNLVFFGVKAETRENWEGLVLLLIQRAESIVEPNIESRQSTLKKYVDNVLKLCELHVRLGRNAPDFKIDLTKHRAWSVLQSHVDRLGEHACDVCGFRFKADFNAVFVRYLQEAGL